MTSETTNTPEFKQFALDERLLTALDEIGFKNCTPIQAECLPLILEGHDIAGQAQTGTGKTAAFLLSTFNLLLSRPAANKNSNLRALIIAPTRELAIQIHSDAEKFNKHCGLKLGLVYGGVDYEKQRKSLENGIDILIGTPGRLIDYSKQKVFSFKDVEIVVLDEADRMFDLGFISDIRFMLRRMPKPDKRLNMLFSATLSHRVMELAYEHMNSPTQVKINPEQVTADNVTQVLYHVANDEKIPLLIGLLQHMDPHRTIVFVNTKRVAEKVWSFLEGNGIHSAILSGDVPQKKRQRLFAEFSNGELSALVATDLAARGLHIPDVSHVFNYDLPQNCEDYVHRIGRTARAGASGDAISFGCEGYIYSLMDIEAYVGYSIPTAKITDDLLATPKPPVKRKHHAQSQPYRKKTGGRPPRRSGNPNRQKT
ncbi:MAG TPA: DEAD/DEAH box helicase [Thiotrichaceae bacterium]|jgi:ATP-dependent RNA helicase RhlB|nr:DEAD/DEAH box helicase [Thiotrichaceae bacterium]HIM08911.1 DEAD/DEAH box helicase [Gammaproteobacteria bacterium]